MDDINARTLMGPRADFKPELFDTAIQQKGYKVIWEQGMFCSCYNAQSGQPDYNCLSCHGKGYTYFDPVETRVLVTSINGHKEQEKPGLNEMGTAYLTPLSWDNVGFRDRFTFVDFTMKFSEVIVRGTGQVDKLRYKARKFIRCHVLGDTYRQGIDFNLSLEGDEIIWEPDKIPHGTQYAVIYDTPPAYIAMSPIHELRGTYIMAKGYGLERFVILPKQYQIKREDFVDNVQFALQRG